MKKTFIKPSAAAYKLKPENVIMASIHGDVGYNLKPTSTVNNDYITVKPGQNAKPD